MRAGSRTRSLATAQHSVDELGEIAAAKPMAGDPRRHRGGEVAILVADQEAPVAVDGPRAQQVEDHSGGRLAPVAGAAIGGDNALRMVRTVADVVDMRPGGGE